MKINSLNIKKTWLIIAAFLGGIFSHAATSVDPRQQSLIMYQIMVSSFQHGDGGAPGYTQMWGPDGHTKNGNLRGIINALDHIAGLGVNAIWLTPIFDSSNALGGEKLQATGYFTNDYFKIDPHFGTEAEFRELVDEAHKRGIYVILDGVFGHHGGVTTPSPSGHTIDSTVTLSDRGEQGGTGNVSYPGSLDYMKEVASYWIDKYGIDGWRLDQSYQMTQHGHNYWTEIRQAVEDAAARRKARGEQWGTLGYMVGEDWGPAVDINKRTLRDLGLLSVFDFDGKERISGPMQNPEGEGLENGWDDLILAWASPTERGYLSNEAMPNLFLTNHDGYRLADHFDGPDRYAKMMTRYAILAGYPGPVTLYYGDEYGDLSKDTQGGQPDNIARTTGHLYPRSADEQALRDFVSGVMHFRQQNPAMWRGDNKYDRRRVGDADVLIVEKKDAQTGNEVVIIFADQDVPALDAPGLPAPVALKAWVPLYYRK